VHLCLNSQELEQLIDFRTFNSTIEDAYLSECVDQSENWQLELDALTYLFSHVLHRKAKGGWHCPSLISLFYQLQDQMFFYIQECDFYFIEYILRNTRRKELSLEEELVDFQDRLREHRYERNLRY
jgi:hypothetical protein